MTVDVLSSSAGTADDGAAHAPGFVGRVQSCVDAAPRCAASLEAKPAPPSLVDPDEQPPLSTARQTVLENRVAHARRLVDSVLELFDGAIVENDVVGVLAADWGVLPAGTPVVRRATSRAVVH